MRRAADDKKRRHGGDSYDGDPVRDIKGPSIGSAQWSEEIFLLNESPRSDREFNISWTTPDGGYNCEDYD